MLAVAAVALAVTAATAAPAQAGRTLLKWVPCSVGTSTTGQIDTANVMVENSYRITVGMRGSLDFCRPITADYWAFGAAWYSSTAAKGWTERLALNTPQQYPFGAELEIAPDAEAVCVLATDSIRVACVSIAWASVDGVRVPSVTGPLPVDAPLVNRPATVYMYDDGSPGGPTCPSCD